MRPRRLIPRFLRVFQLIVVMGGFSIRDAPITSAQTISGLLTTRNAMGGIFMGNDATYKVVGIDTVKIKIWDGVTRTLNDARHIPTLKKNLIPLSTLDANGCVIQAEDRAMKVKKGSMVILRGTKPNNLYKLKRNTVTGGTVVSTEVEGDKL